MKRQTRNNTDNLLAASLKTCMETSPIDKIPIQKITDGCNLNRQTFYYHFKDIYDLVRYVLFQDIRRLVSGVEHMSTWDEALHCVLKKMDEERDYYVAIYASANYEQVRYDFMEYLAGVLDQRLDARFTACGFDTDYRGFLTREYGLVLFEFVEKWQRGVSYSTMDDFITNFSRTYDDQMTGASLRAAQVDKQEEGQRAVS